LRFDEIPWKLREGMSNFHIADIVPISQEELAAEIAPQLQKLRNQEYELKRQAVDNLVLRTLLEAEAGNRGITVEALMEAEVDSKVPEPTEPEIKAFYEGQKERINQPLEEVQDQIREVLRQSRRQQFQQDFLQRLREGAEVAVRLVPPRNDVAADPSRMLGRPDAPVEIVEFSDFQCPFCQQAYPTIMALVKKYEDHVSLSYRDFPLRSMHPRAQIAAHAARCAGEQGKFWEYHNSLFELPNQLGNEELELHAATVGVDTDQFRSCLESGRYDEAIEDDLQAGMQAGISGTPAFFINGILVSGSQSVSVFEQTIETELAAAGQNAEAAK
jgi:protein-disulfide isomerase